MAIFNKPPYVVSKHDNIQLVNFAEVVNYELTIIICRCSANIKWMPGVAHFAAFARLATCVLALTPQKINIGSNFIESTHLN